MYLIHKINVWGMLYTFWKIKKKKVKKTTCRLARSNSQLVLLWSWIFCSGITFFRNEMLPNWTQFGCVCGSVCFLCCLKGKWACGLGAIIWEKGTDTMGLRDGDLTFPSSEPCVRTYVRSQMVRSDMSSLEALLTFQFNGHSNFSGSAQVISSCPPRFF